MSAPKITDAQIRELYDAGAISFDTLFRAVHRERRIGESKDAYERSRNYHRARCVEILNARSKA